MKSMNDTELEYGPIQVYVIEFEGTGIDPGVLDALIELSASGTVRVVDLILASRLLDGTVNISELREDPNHATAVFEIDLAVEGLIGDEDISEALATVPPGYGVAIAAIEMRWALELAERLRAANGRVVRTEHVPAPAVNALIATALTQE